MVSVSFAQRKLSKNSLRIKSLGLSQTPPFSTAYPPYFAALVNERRIAKDCKKKEEGNRKRRREQT